jgi:hypothetical protein
MVRTDIINIIAHKYHYRSYLEIGCQYRHVNFDRILCPRKVCVDPDPRLPLKADYPMTSDAFFAQNVEMFDLFFIDGLHEHEQVERDIQNCLKFMNPGGTIVMHDCNPTTEIMQRVPRAQLEWTGDTWKAFVKTRQNRMLRMYVVDTDYGVGVIREGLQTPIYVSDEDLTYENFEERRKEWLNLISVQEFLKEEGLI